MQTAKRRRADTLGRAADGGSRVVIAAAAAGVAGRSRPVASALSAAARRAVGPRAATIQRCYWAFLGADLHRCIVGLYLGALAWCGVRRVSREWSKYDSRPQWTALWDGQCALITATIFFGGPATARHLASADAIDEVVRNDCRRVGKYDRHAAMLQQICSNIRAYARSDTPLPIRLPAPPSKRSVAEFCLRHFLCHECERDLVRIRGLSDAHAAAIFVLGQSVCGWCFASRRGRRRYAMLTASEITDFTSLTSQEQEHFCTVLEPGVCVASPHMPRLFALAVYDSAAVRHWYGSEDNYANARVLIGQLRSRSLEQRARAKQELQKLRQRGHAILHMARKQPASTSAS